MARLSCFGKFTVNSLTSHGRKLSLFAAFLLPTACTTASQPQSCEIGTLGRLPVLNSRGSPLVRVTINGHPVIMMMDSGADYSTISRSAVDKLNLKWLPGHVYMRGVGGYYASAPYQADKIGLGAGSAREVLLLDTPRDFRTFNGEPIVGLFGGDFLSSYDIVYDLPSGTISLYDMKNCHFSTPYWHGEKNKIAFTDEHENHLSLILKLNNHPIDAYLDSGAARTVVTMRQAHHAGATDAVLGADYMTKTHGVDMHNLEGHLHRFDSLQIGTKTYLHPMLNVSELSTDNYALLGADFLRHNRVWVSRRDEAVYYQSADKPDQPDATFEIISSQGKALMPAQKLEKSGP